MLIGAGGHASVVLDALRRSGAGPVVGTLDDNVTTHGHLFHDVRVIGGHEKLSDYPPERFDLVMGVVGFGEKTQRWRLLDELRALGYHLAAVIHPSAVIAASACYDEGAQVLVGSIVNPGAHIGRDAIVNSAVVVEHDNLIGAGAHLAPRVTLGGGVVVGERAQIGMGAVVLQGLTVGAGAIVGAGAVVTQSVEPHTVVVGVPAKFLKRIGAS